MTLLVDHDLKLHQVIDEASLTNACTGHAKPVQLAKNLRKVLGWTKSGGPSGERDRSRETDNWQQLVDVRYIQADGSSEVIALVGKLSNRHRLACKQGCTLADGTLAHVLNEAKPFAKDKDKRTWRLVKQAPACVAQLGHGDSLVGLQADEPHSPAVQAPGLYLSRLAVSA